MSIYRTFNKRRVYQKFKNIRIPKMSYKWNILLKMWL